MSGRWTVIAILTLLALGCGDQQPTRISQDYDNPTVAPPVDWRPSATPNAVELPSADQRLCTSVVLLIDVSPSMQDAVSDGKGGQRRKFDIARDVLAGMVDYTDQWTKQHTDRTLILGLSSFSNHAQTLLAPSKFNRAAADDSLQRIPFPGNGTAIGEALKHGFQSLYKTGCVRKYIIVITDGENTVGDDPESVARRLYQQTQGEVEIHFVAFDVSASHFAFLKDVNGYVVEAADAEQLKKQLSDIYEKRILAEAMPAEQQ
jgi:Mg-chelatase subunit ChlD